MSEEMNCSYSQSEGRDATIALTGDSLITRRLRPYRENSFMDMISIIRNADISFTNLEGLLTNYDGVPAASSGGTYVVGEPVIADDLKWAGFNLYARANNHSMDWSHGGLLATSEQLDRRNMVHAGVGPNLALARAPAYLDTAAGRVALLSASSTFPDGAQAGRQRADLPGRPGLNPLRYRRILELPKSELRHLKRMSKKMGFEKMKEAWDKMRPKALQKQQDDEGFRFGSQHFVPSSDGEYRVRTEVNPGDLKGNLEAIRGASRQADWVIFSIHSHEFQMPRRRQPAGFLRDFSRQAIEAGADMVVGHGPHYLKGIEIHRGRPIFYSLGNFIFQNETVAFLPQEIYDRYNLEPGNRPDELYDARTDQGKSGFPADAKFWRSVLVEVTFCEAQLNEITYHPVTLGHKRPRSRRGRPVLAQGKLAREIICEIAALSEPFDTEISWDQASETGLTNLS